MKRLVQHARQVVDVLDQIIVFRARPRDADRVAFLERVVADEMRRHLPGDDDERNGIAQRIGQAGDRIGGAGARRHQHRADLAGRARIAFGGMHRALFVAHQNVLHHVLLKQRVIDRQHRAAGIAENVLDALIGQRLDHHFRAGHFGAGFGSGRLWLQRSCHSWSAPRPLLSHSGPLIRLISLASQNSHSGNKKGASKSPWSRTATFRGWNYPPPAVRLDTRISDVATNVRTCCALCVQRVIYKHCVCLGQGECGGIAAFYAEQISNMRLKSIRRAKLQSLTNVKCHSCAAISRFRGL